MAPGRARYTMICAADGGVLDDLIVYRLADEEFLVVANASNTGVVDAALGERADGHDARITDQTDAYALIAIQGPAAAGILGPLTDVALDGVKYYTSHQGTVAGREVLLARTGYTGEDGFELFSRPGDAEHLWRALSRAGTAAGLVPAGLAARDTLRLEAGMPLYGNELGPDTTPFDAGLGRVVKLGKPGDFVGRAALADAAQAPPSRVLVGLRSGTRRVPRRGYPVLWGRAAGRHRHQRRPLPHPGRAHRHGVRRARGGSRGRRRRDRGRPGRGGARRARPGRDRRRAAHGGHQGPRRAGPDDPAALLRSDPRSATMTSPRAAWPGGVADPRRATR